MRLVRILRAHAHASHQPCAVSGREVRGDMSSRERFGHEEGESALCVYVFPEHRRHGRECVSTLISRPQVPP